MKNLVKEYRSKSKMTQDELAKKCQVTRQTIISLENGRYNPSIYLAHSIANVFDTIIEEIFLFEE